MVELHDDGRGCLPEILAPRDSDAVVVLGGPNWQIRVDHALKLWEQRDVQTTGHRDGFGSPLFIYTGLMTDGVTSHLAQRIGEGAAIGYHQGRLVFDTQAHNTIQNASNVKRYLRHVLGPPFAGFRQYSGWGLPGR